MASSSSKRTLAIILGAGPGTGAALAKAFAKTHGAVALLARNEAKLAGLVAEVEQAGGAASPFTCDVTEAASVDAAFNSFQGQVPRAQRHGRHLQRQLAAQSGTVPRAQGGRPAPQRRVESVRPSSLLLRSSASPELTERLAGTAPSASRKPSCLSCSRRAAASTASRVRSSSSAPSSRASTDSLTASVSQERPPRSRARPSSRRSRRARARCGSSVRPAPSLLSSSSSSRGPDLRDARAQVSLSRASSARKACTSRTSSSTARPLLSLPPRASHSGI